MPSGRVIICCALEIEARAVARALGVRVGAAEPGLPEVHVVGIGARHVPSLDESVALLLSVGLAGAIDPTLRRGDVIVDDATRAIHIDGQPRCRPGRVYHDDHLVATPELKSELFRASGGAAVVDMETAVLRRVAEQSSIRFAAIRSVCDQADEVLHPALNELVDEHGRASISAAIVRLIRSPGLLPEMLRARRWSNESLTSLARVLSGLL